MIFFRLVWLSCLTIILLTIVCFIIICKICNGYWMRKGVFTFQSRFFFGNVRDVVLQKEGWATNLKNYYDVLKRNGKRFGGFYFLFRPVLFVSDLDLIKRILITDFTHFMDHPFHVNEKKDPLSWNLFSIRGEEWRSLRAKVTPAFSTSKLKQIFETMLDSCKEIEDVVDKSIESGEVIDLYNLFANLSINVTGSCAFGINCHSFSNTHNRFKQYGLEYMHPESLWGQLAFFLSYTFPEVFKFLDLTVHNKEMTDYFIKLTEDLVKYREENNIVRNDVMHFLIQIRNNVGLNKSTTKVKEDFGLSMVELAALCFSFLIGGYEATSTTITFCMYEISLDEQLQEKLRNEIITVLQNYGGRITYDSLMKMKFMDQCINETLRKYPPAPNHIRVCTETYKLPNSEVIITKGTHVYIPVYGIHMDPSYYPKPEVFDPERFSEMGKSNRPSGAWIPFGDGPRMCIAYQFGLLQIKTVLAILMTQYKFSIHESTKLPITMCPKNAVLYPSSSIFVSAHKI